MSTTKRKRYSLKFQADAVKTILTKGYSVAEASRTLGIEYSVLRRWKKKYETIINTDSALDRNPVSHSQIIAELKSELERITEERDILLKTLSHVVAHQK